MPFALLGLDSDNGSEFINLHLARYCDAEHITFTRSRPYRKNDNCYIEQKNYSIVRRTVAYYRYATPPQLELLNAIYQHLRLYANFFLPVMKLQHKTRSGSRVSRCYDTPQTPYKRLLAHPLVPQKVKDSLSAHYSTLNVVALKQNIGRLQQALFRSAIAAGPPPRPKFGFPHPDHPWRKTFPTPNNQHLLLAVAPPETQKNRVDLLQNIHHTHNQYPKNTKNHE